MIIHIFVLFFSLQEIPLLVRYIKMACTNEPLVIREHAYPVDHDTYCCLVYGFNFIPGYYTVEYLVLHDRIG
jgi:hypothetical protein